ncbi:MAG: tetratricopeptide repeat protein [Limisphaerales bacterium]
MRRNLFICLALAGITLAVYWPALRCDFVNYDDPQYLTANPHVQGGLTWAGLKWAFGNTQQAAYWAPLMWLSHMLGCQCFGLNAWGHHLINVLLHAANTVLVFLVFQRMTRATWRSLMLAALFGWHPLRVESVAWVTERKDVLSSFFGLLTLLCYAKAVTGDKWPAFAALRRGKQVTGKQTEAAPAFILSRVKCHVSLYYWLAVFFFALGLMSKAMLVTIPCVLLLLDYWPLQRVTGDKWKVSGMLRLVREKIPFFILATAASVVTFVVQKQGGAVLAVESLPLGVRVETALISYCRYLGKMFWPTDLAVFYPHPRHWPLEEAILAGVFLCGISVLLFVKRGRYPFLLMGWLWFVGTLVPVIQLVQSGQQAMADRFTYIPSLGVLILVVWGAHELTRRWRHQAVALALAGSVAMVLCLAVTRQQLGYWQDSETLFRHTLEVTENNYIAHKTLGDALLDKGQMDEAIGQYEEAIRIRPNYDEAHNNLGSALARKHQIDGAISQYQEAIRIRPDFVSAHYNLGVALSAKGQIDEAAGQFQEAIRLKPNYADAHNSLGIAFARKHQMDEAMSQFQEAIRLKPDGAEAHYNLGNAFFIKGQTAEAISQYQEAIRLKPDYANAQKNLNLAKALELKKSSGVEHPTPQP